MKNFISRVLVKPSCLAAFLMASGCAGAVTANLAAIASTCATDHLRACEVVASAVINMDFAPPVSVQIQSGYTEEDGIRAGLVIYEQKNNSWQILMEDYQGVRYGMPQISEGEVLSLLHISGQRLGTGIGNADLLFTSASDEAPWQSVDIETWKETIGELLPQELAIWHGVDYDFGDWTWTAYTARTELWHDSDANCCPTGGEAVIHFDIINGILTTKSVDYHPPVKLPE